MAIDAAIYITNKIIDIKHSTHDTNYTVDFFKVHKLLYFAQGLMLSYYDYPMFKEDISAHTCGVYVGGLDSFYENVGTQEITKKIEDTIINLLTPERRMVLDYIAIKYGNIDRDKLIKDTQKHEIYRKAYDKTVEGHPKPIISKEEIQSYFYGHKDTFYEDFKGV